MANKFRIDSIKAYLENGRLTLLLNALQNLLPRLNNRVLDSGRINASIDDQLVQSRPSHLATNRIEAADHNRLKHVVDDKINADNLLKNTNVAPFPANDPTLNLLVKKRQHQ